MDKKAREVAIVGGGPAGLTAGLYLCRSDVDAVMLDRELTGGQAILSPLIENYPGFPDGVEGTELVGRMKEQAERFGLEIMTFAQVTGVTLEGEAMTLHLEDGELNARAVIVATGRNPRKMGIPGEEEYGGRGISYCATCDGPLFRDRAVMVIGGGDSAVEEALHLAKFAGKVIIVHRRGELRASSYLVERAAAEPKLEFMWNSEITAVNGGETVDSATIVNSKTGDRTDVPVSGIFFYVGNDPNSAFLSDLLELDDAGYIVTDERLESSVPGIFAAGDVRAGRFKQVVVAAGEGALAASSAQGFLEEVGARRVYEGDR
ncbi:MAG: thioredoxin-disulfide reductase [Actinobacteria bacterium]|nr:thioredoxin-disulfide reductase [Actinomycetota bacterium]